MEFLLAHILDKPFEAQFKFIHVLPGAFSAYNMKSLHTDPEMTKTNDILKSYFTSLEDKMKQQYIHPTNYSPYQLALKVIMPDILYRCLSCEEQI